jgi:UDP-N-acetylglucosamine:LPS N-acetylglucosamine transferase
MSEAISLKKGLCVEERGDPDLPRALIFSCKGGSAHLSAAKALMEFMGGRFSFSVIYPIEEIAIPGVRSTTDWYNYFVAKGNLKLVSRVGSVATRFLRHFARWILPDRNLNKYLRDRKISLIISVAPMINEWVLSLGVKHHLPVLIVTLDNTLENWMGNVHGKVLPRHLITICRQLPGTTKLLVDRGVKRENIRICGMPLRRRFQPSFESKKDVRVRLGLDRMKKVLLIMSGGSGMHVPISYLKSLYAEGRQIVVLCGRNQKMVDEIHEAEIEDIYGIGYIENVWDYFSCASLLITKPGPTTMEEAIRMRLPIIMDASKGVMNWERPNLKILTERGFGRLFSDPKELPTIVTDMLTHKREKRNLQRLALDESEALFAGAIDELMMSKPLSE